MEDVGDHLAFSALHLAGVGALSLDHLAHLADERELSGLPGLPFAGVEDEPFS